MRTPLVLLSCALLGIVGGAFLIGTWAVGCAVIFDSLCLGAWAVWGYDDGQPADLPETLPQPGAWTVPDIFERARNVP